MKNTAITIILLFLLQIDLSSQISTYDISQFVIPDVERSTLSLSTSIGLDRGQNSQFFFNSRDYLNGDISLDVDNTNYKNSRKSVSSRFSSLDLDLDYRWLENEDAYYEYSVRGQNIYSNKVYFQPKTFIDFGFDAIIVKKETTNVNANSNDKYELYNTTIPVSIGVGRKELVTDAWHAQTILEFLNDQGLLKKDLTHDEINNFASEIAYIRNLRNTDRRLEEISEYTRLIKYLVENDIADTEDYRFFAVLRDVWLYERPIIRQHGKTNQIGVEVFLFGRKNNADVIAEGWEYNRSYDIFYKYEKDHVINSDFQTITSVTLSGGLNTFDESQQSSYYDARMNVAGYFQYYPNFRSNYQIGMTAFTSKILSDETSPSYSVSLSGEMRYYISPRLTWRFSASMSLFNSVFEDEQKHFNRESIDFTTNYFFY